jgi:hypothetical protein
VQSRLPEGEFASPEVEISECFIRHLLEELPLQLGGRVTMDENVVVLVLLVVSS